MTLAWTNTGDRSYVVALTSTHIVTSGNTNSRRGSRRLIDEWSASSTGSLPNEHITLPIAEVRQLRSSSFSSRITVVTNDTVLTMRGFQKGERKSAASSIAKAAGLVQTASLPRGVDQFVLPGEALERFDGDGDGALERPEELTIRSPFWAFHGVFALITALLWAIDLSRGQASAIEALLVGFAAAFSFVAAVRFLLIRMTFRNDGIVIVNFWRSHTIDWADVKGANATERSIPGWHLPVVSFKSEVRCPSTVTTCVTKSRAQRIARQTAAQMDSRLNVRSEVHADDLMFSGRPSSISKECLNAGSFFARGRS